MSDDYQRIEVITGTARRRRWSAAEKLRIVEGEEDKERPQRGVSLTNLDSRESVSSVARRNGVAPNLLYRWRRLMTEGGAIAVQADDGVTGNGEVRRLEARVRELERQLGRKTLEVEILKEALVKSGAKASLCPPLVRGQWRATLLARSPLPGLDGGGFAVSAVARTLGVARSNLVERLDGRAKPRRRYQKSARR